MQTTIIELTDDNFKHVLSMHENVFVDFYATWCGPCRTIEPEVKKIIESIDYKKIFIKEIVFEYKHLDGTFSFQNNLKKLIKFLNSKNFKETTRDKENITFKIS